MIRVMYFGVYIGVGVYFGGFPKLGVPRVTVFWCLYGGWDAFWGFPKIGGVLTPLGLHWGYIGLYRVILGLYWGSLILGNYYLGFLGQPGKPVACNFGFLALGLAVRLSGFRI